ncbi:hypothetical protein Tco_1169392 [Tanacetum coccineum]
MDENHLDDDMEVVKHIDLNKEDVMKEVADPDTDTNTDTDPDAIEFLDTDTNTDTDPDAIEFLYVLPGVADPEVVV